MEQVSASELAAMLERGELSVSVFYRRQSLIAVAELAAAAKGHTPISRARLQQFLSILRVEENNDGGLK